MDLRENKALTPVESRMPITASTIDLTKRCNLACDYCFAHCYSKDYNKVDLSPELGKHIIDWLLDDSTNGGAKQLDISFWGGEPLLKWDLLQELVLYAEEKAKPKGIRLTFGGTTNVTLLTPDKFDFMDAHNVHFLLSIDGTKEHHDKHRKFRNGTGSHDVIDKNIDAIIKRWPMSQARISYSVENLDGFLEDLDYLYGKGFRDIVYSPVSEGNWTEERLQKLSDVWVKIADWYVEKHKSGNHVAMKFIEDGCRAAQGVVRADAPCGAGRTYVGITVDGAIYPCHRFNKFDDPRPWYEREVCLGHVNYGILNQEWRENFIDWTVDKDLPESCKQCRAYKTGCTGGCWATNWDLNRDLRKVPHMNCYAELETMKQGDKVAKELGERYVASLMPIARQQASITNLPRSQGCQCYNVHDDLYGRQITNTGDISACLCNMSVYGVKPGPVTSCTCYNVENDRNGIVDGYFDSSEASCRNYVQAPPNPVKVAIEYLKRKETQLDKAVENETKDLDEFYALKDAVEAKEQELQTLQDIRKTVEK